MYDLCTCNDLDQIEFLVYYPKQKQKNNFTVKQVFGITARDSKEPLVEMLEILYEFGLCIKSVKQQHPRNFHEVGESHRSHAQVENRYYPPHRREDETSAMSMVNV